MKTFDLRTIKIVQQPVPEIIDRGSNQLNYYTTHRSVKNFPITISTKFLDLYTCLEKDMKMLTSTLKIHDIIQNVIGEEFSI